MIPGIVAAPAARIGVRGGMAVSEGVDMIQIALEEHIKQLLHAIWAHNLQQHTEGLHLFVHNGIDIPLWSTRLEQEERGDRNEELNK